MKKAASIIMAICMISVCSACNSSDAEQNVLVGGDYKPTVCVEGNLYGDTGYVCGSISEQAILIGTIEKLIPQNEKISMEEFLSNSMPVGSEIYLDESDSDIIYIKFLQEGKEKYSIYEMIQ